MKTTAFVFVTVVIAVVSANENLQAEATTEGDEDIVRVTDAEGKLVSTVDVHPEDKYELLKPNDEDVCLVSPIPENGDNPDQCYERVSLPKDLEDDKSINLDECEGREALLLKPLDPKDCNDAALATRRGRSFCFFTHVVLCYCAKYERFCAKRSWLFGTCVIWTTRCARYSAIFVPVLICS